MNEIKQDTKDLAEKVKQGLSINKEGAVTVQEGLYEKTLPDGLTIGQVKAVHDHHSNMVAASALAVGELALPIMKKNSSLERVEATIPIVGRDTMTVVTQRSKEGRNPTNGETTMTWGRTTVGVDFHASGNRGELKKVRNHLADAFEAALGK